MRLSNADALTVVAASQGHYLILYLNILSIQMIFKYKPIRSR